ncbi:2,5-diketo-D-gluconic acid reductase A [Teratosphaeria destructans]|uniref:2,5-diketo-D-gluconic acid reductase A n=1 Tax=Teratosphaeria destructans TaxID=418781 RepID=A0A9W7SNL5_9PEZI|nr:2,5-diketo-D-gluconic acid reductase A [Teratosphaeria destructans]
MAKFDINSKAKLASGYEIPLLGFGVYQTPADIAEDVTDHAIQVGYRHVDSATAYRNEQPTVAGMLKAKVPRDQLFFTSKVPARSISYQGAKDAVEESLRKTGLEYIDLYLLHAPYGGTEGRLGAWQALVEAAAEGKVRSIGVSNYGVHHLNELEEWQESQPKEKAGTLSVNQIELHPWLQRKDIVEWCKARNVVLEAYSPLVRGTRFNDTMLTPLVKKHNKTPAQILLRWGLQQGFVVLPKSVTKSRIEENKEIYDFELDENDMNSLDTSEYSPCCWDPTTAPLSQ